MLISAPLATASSAMNENSLVGMPSGPSRTTSSSAPSDSARTSVETTIEAVMVTSR